jgi:hypothetical protein
MKKQLTSRILSYLVASLAFSSVFAQYNKQAIPASFPSSGTTSVVANTSTASATAAVNTKVQRSFGRLFQGATAPRWYANTKRFAAEFKVGDRRAVASFGKKGHLNYAIFYGTGQHLPAAEKEVVQSAYRDYEITTTQEVTIDGLKLWIVTMENCKNIIKVGLMDGNLYDLNHIQKTK